MGLHRHYVFFTQSPLPLPDKAHLVHDVHSANAAANLGYPAVLVYLEDAIASYNPLNWVHPYRPRPPKATLAQFYQLQNQLKAVALPMPWPFGQVRGGKWTSPSTLVCKYYFPLHIFPQTGVLHTLNWNLVKAAVRQKIPVIYEREHYADKPYDPEIVNSPFFKVAVTVADPVRQDLIRKGMPPDKILQLHLGYNQAFQRPQPEAVRYWRQRLLGSSYTHLVVYSGALHRFKGVDLLLEVARLMPQVKFVLAGGSADQVQAYQARARDLSATNAEFLGYLAHDQLPGLLQAADALAHPHCAGEAASFTSPLKFFDYLASGTPIVATEIPPLQEFKPYDWVAAWCEPDRPQRFAQCLSRVLETRSKGQNTTQSARFVREFSWERRIEKIMARVESTKPALATPIYS